jgi:Na+-driven multidrug efflux pump
MMPNFSFGNAMTVFSGQNVGAGKLDRVSKGTKQCILMAMATALVMVTVILIFGRFIAGAFTQTEEVIVLSVRFLRILGVGYVMFALNMVLWGTIRGAGDAITPMWAALLNTVAVRVPSAYIFVHIFDKPEALFYSLLLGWTTNMLLAVISYRIGKWRTKRIITEPLPEPSPAEI